MALQTQGKMAAKLQSFRGREEDGDAKDLGGVFKMWEGEDLDLSILLSLWSVSLFSCLDSQKIETKI
ncbi:hypothetical protein ACFX1T_022900 [Malus domestica]